MSVCDGVYKCAASGPTQGLYQIPPFSLTISETITKDTTYKTT